VLQCVAVCCSVLQNVSKEETVGKGCDVAKEWGDRKRCVGVYCSVLQCVAVRCRALQCVAVRCNEKGVWGGYD